METNRYETLKADPRYWASGMGASDRITELLLELFTPEDVSLIGLRRNYLCNTDRWRPSDALRQAASEAAKKLDNGGELSYPLN